MGPLACFFKHKYIMQTLTITRPDDWHLHVRTGAILKNVVPHTAEQFARAVIMPNLTPPITTVKQALTYQQEIQRALPSGIDFSPLMALYLTTTITQEEIKLAADSSSIIGCKLYPAGVTTNSAAGITDITAMYPTFEAMEKWDVPLLVHGEVPDPLVDQFDREKIFIDRYLEDIVKNFPCLRVSFEHLSTQEAVEFVTSSSSHIVATITPQHLMFNRNALFEGGLQPHRYCLPVLKREVHRQALVAAATSGNPKFFLGTDSAPHLQHLKEQACGCAGCYTAHAALPFYAEIFELADALNQLEGFASHYGADFYRLPRNQDTLKLRKEDWTIPNSYETAIGSITPLRANTQIGWRVVS